MPGVPCGITNRENRTENHLRVGRVLAALLCEFSAAPSLLTVNCPDQLWSSGTARDHLYLRGNPRGLANETDFH